MFWWLRPHTRGIRLIDPSLLSRLGEVFASRGSTVTNTFFQPLSHAFFLQKLNLVHRKTLAMWVTSEEINRSPNPWGSSDIRVANRKRFEFLAYVRRKQFFISNIKFVYRYFVPDSVIKEMVHDLACSVKLWLHLGSLFSFPPSFLRASRTQWNTTIHEPFLN